MAKTGEKPTKLEDLALVELALQRDQGAFALLLEKYRSSLMTHILKYVTVVEDAEDICQRSFEKAFMNIDRYNPQYAFSTICAAAGPPSIPSPSRKTRRPSTCRPPRRRRKN